MAARGASHVGVAARRVHRARIALLALVLIQRAVAAKSVHQAAVKIANSVGVAIAIAVVTCLACILNSISAFLGRPAVVAARIEDKHTGVVHFAVHAVAVVADLGLVDDAVPAGVVWEIEPASSSGEVEKKSIEAVIVVCSYN